MSTVPWGFTAAQRLIWLGLYVLAVPLDRLVGWSVGPAVAAVAVVVAAFVQVLASRGGYLASRAEPATGPAAIALSFLALAGSWVDPIRAAAVNRGPNDDLHAVASMALVLMAWLSLRIRHRGEAMPRYTSALPPLVGGLWLTGVAGRDDSLGVLCPGSLAADCHHLCQSAEALLVTMGVYWFVGASVVALVRLLRSRR